MCLYYAKIVVKSKNPLIYFTTISKVFTTFSTYMMHGIVMFAKVRSYVVIQGDSIYSWYSGSGSESEAAVGDRWGGRVQRVGDGRLGLGRGSINVTAVRETDAGVYRCRVTFPNRTPPARNNGTFYHLDVEGGNLIATPPVNATVLEGERAELECLPKSVDSTVDWYRDGTPLDRLLELADRAERPSNGSLVLRQASSTDPGEYSCRVRDPAGGVQSAAAFLDVQCECRPLPSRDPPLLPFSLPLHFPSFVAALSICRSPTDAFVADAAKVVYAPEERFLPLGKPASLDCHFSANPPLTNLRWEKDGFLFDPYNVPGVFYSRNGSLLFNQVRRHSPFPSRGASKSNGETLFSYRTVTRGRLYNRSSFILYFRWTNLTRVSIRARLTTRWALGVRRRACACACCGRPRLRRARCRCTWRGSAPS